MTLNKKQHNEIKKQNDNDKDYRNSGFLSRFWQRLQQYWVNYKDIQVWQRVDCTGNHSWQAYDPDTGKRAEFGSEREMLAWLEQQFYR